MNTPCKFVHEVHGEWIGLPDTVIRRGATHPKESQKRRLETFQSKYGGGGALCSPEIARRARRAVTNMVILKHWKTGEDIECTGCFEYGVINKLNALEIDYKWQIPIKLSDSVYYCDLYIPLWDKYIEIKGFFFPRSKAKWEEFSAKYLNSELWLRDKVVEFTGKSIYANSKLFKMEFVRQHCS